ncbi:MAG: glucose 1-dehydrogenase [Alphaproteobacteria bacterium]|nr:glucose 1-dehydrogenase [Alphaproteobacteria bacterium]
MGGRLEGKVAVITGGASGIGRGTVELFVEEGARVVCADVQEDYGVALAQRLGPACQFLRTDVTRESDIKAAIDFAMAEFGRLDCLFNNAGSGGPAADFEEMDAAAFESVMNLHVRAAMFGIKHAAPAMRASGGGSIISTASVAALGTNYGPMLYSVAKAAIVHTTKMAALRYGPENIRVNCICPGFIITAIFARGLGFGQEDAERTYDMLRKGASEAQAIGRPGEPRDIAEAALYLASDNSGFVTGQALVVDGGLTTGLAGPRRLDRMRPLFEALGIDVEAYARERGMVLGPGPK